MTEYKEFEEELETLVDKARESLAAILLSEDRVSKHPPYSWKKEDINEHIFKAVGHIMYGMNQYCGYKKQDGEDHLHNAITRLIYAKYLIDNNKVIQCPNCNAKGVTEPDFLFISATCPDGTSYQSLYQCAHCGCQFTHNKEGKTERYNP